jgi:carbonic anhydrase
MTCCTESDIPPSRPDKVAWGYHAGNGPDVWGRLSPDFALCADGTRQSPVDLRDPSAERLPPIIFNYRPTALEIGNTGRTVLATPSVENRIVIAGEKYSLLQFHYHAPSEHTVEGKSFDMEMHLVHRNEEGALAVIGVLIEKGNPLTAFDRIRAHLPHAPGENKRIDGVPVNIGDLLPRSKRSYRYEGSLTTPPCSESVKWIVMAAPVQLSETQIGAFANIVHKNNRPVQALNGREILVDIGDGS